MSFGGRYDGFSLFGLVGIVAIIIYIRFMFYCANKKYNFIFSKITLSIYIILLIWLSFLFKTNITSANKTWPQVMLLCILVDGLIYLIKH